MNFFSKNWLVNSIVEKELKVVFKKYAKGDLIDIGCGSKPFAKHLKEYVDIHVGLDYADSPYLCDSTDATGTAYKIPFPDNHFDTALCTAVLEHLEEPSEAIKEANRILKKNGIAIYTVPFFWHLHDQPRDFFRYTKYGLKHLFEKNHFEVLKSKPLSGFWVTFTQELSYYLANFLEKYKFLKYPLLALIFLIQLFGYLMNKKDKTYEFTWMYLLVVKKTK